MRTKAALAQKKAQGAVLGNRTNLSDALAANREAADAFAANVLPSVRQIPDGRCYYVPRHRCGIERPGRAYRTRRGFSLS